MTIDQHGSKWRVRYTYNKKTYTVTFDHKPTKREAQDAIDRKRNAPAPAARMRFAEAYSSYIDVKSNVLSPSSIRSYQSIYRCIPEWFKILYLDQINHVCVQKLVNDYAIGHSPKTVSNMYRLVSTVLSMFYPDLVLRTKLPQKIQSTDYIPTEEDIRLIFSAVRGTKYEIPFALATLSLRRSEIAAARVEDLEGNVLHIRRSAVQDEHNNWVIKETNKTYFSSRDILLPDHLADLIRSTGTIYDGSPHYLYFKLQIVCKQLGIPPFPLHKFRHYFASYAHSIGMSDADIMRMGGWKSDHVMKSVYRHAMNVEQSQAAAAAHIAGLLE